MVHGLPRGRIEESGTQIQTAEVKYQAATGGRNGSLDLACVEIEMPESMAFKLGVSCRSYDPAGWLPWWRSRQAGLGALIERCKITFECFAGFPGVKTANSGFLGGDLHEDACER